MKKKALLVLADGTVFTGTALGATGFSVGEVVFNTSMTGYQEILTDPSYSQQMVALTYPHIGNTGTNPEDVESDKIYATGLIIRDLPLVASNFRSNKTLNEYMLTNNIIGIADIDTRKLTRILREKGAQAGCITSGDNLDEACALLKAKNFPGLKGLDLAKEVTTQSNYTWRESLWSLDTGFNILDKAKYRVIAYDYGIKRNILRMLSSRDCEVIVVPATTSATEVLALNPDGIFLSNGPGDPEPCTYAIEAIRALLTTNIPIFGICLGHQLLSLATGASTLKMKFGHHGANHPVQNLENGKVLITSQNHGFAVDATTLPANVKITHKSLFDESLQGIHLIDKPAFSFQGHPEASPGPHECAELFDHFIDLIDQYKN